jgi:hypothetical protein
VTSDLALIALGILAQVATFAVGVGVGRTISRRRDDDHDSDSDEAEEQPTRWRYYDGDRDTQASAHRCEPGGADAGTEAGAGERDAGWRGIDRD